MHNVSPGGGHTWEEADSSTLIELDDCCSPTAETNGCWLSNELPPLLHGCSCNHPEGQGPPCSAGRLQRSPAEREMHDCVVYSQLLKVSYWLKGAKIRHENKSVANLALCFTDLTFTPHSLGQSRSPWDHPERFPPPDMRGTQVAGRPRQQQRSPQRDPQHRCGL